MRVNLDKSNFIHSSSPKSTISFSDYINYDRSVDKVTYGNTAIKFGKYHLKRVTETKFLGVIIDEKLKWNSHIKYLDKKLIYSRFAMGNKKYY